MARTNVYYEHNRVTSEVTISDEGLFHTDDLPDDLGTAQLDLEVVHEVQLADREGNLIILHFNVPKAQNKDREVEAYDGKGRKFSDISDNSMPSGLFTTEIRDNGNTYRSLLQLPNGAE